MRSEVTPTPALMRQRRGEIPILQTLIQRLGLREILLHHIKPHGNESVPAVDVVLVLVWNIACGREPLYELAEQGNRTKIMRPREF